MIATEAIPMPKKSIDYLLEVGAVNYYVKWMSLYVCNVWRHFYRNINQQYVKKLPDSNGQIAFHALTAPSFVNWPKATSRKNMGIPLKITTTM